MASVTLALPADDLRLEKPGYVELVFGVVVLWGFGDVVSTLFAARFAGVGAEANPWIRVLLALDPLWVVALKGAVVLYVGVVLLACRGVIERVPGWRLWLSAVVAGGAVVSLTNVYVGLVAVAAAL